MAIVKPVEGQGKALLISNWVKRSAAMKKRSGIKDIPGKENSRWYTYYGAFVEFGHKTRPSSGRHYTSGEPTRTTRKAVPTPATAGKKIVSSIRQSKGWKKGRAMQMRYLRDQGGWRQVAANKRAYKQAQREELERARSMVFDESQQKYVPGQPYMRPTWDAKENQMAASIQNDLADGIVEAFNH